jgi:hypothetical protein
VLLVGCVLAAGCGGLTNPKPTTAIITDTLVAWAINGTPGHLPAGYELADERVVQTDANLNFDIAFDIDSAGHAVIYPVRLLTDGSISTRHVGLQRVSQPYDSVTFGLRRGYQFDSAYKLGPGDGMLIVSNPLGCLADANPTLYGKFIIDSVNIATRTIHFRATTDPNCGYRSFKPGIPPF